MKKATSDAKKKAAKRSVRPPSASTQRGRDPDELSPEYDPDLLRRGTRGKYAAQYPPGATAVVLEPDVAAVFPDATAVNDALRALAGIIERRQQRKRSSSRRTA
jgi:hypothetical protein